MKALIASILMLVMTTGLSFAGDGVIVKKNIVPTNELYALLVSKDGTLWIGHKYGLTSYDGTHTCHYSLQKKGEGIENLIQDAAGKIWCVSSYGGLFVVKDGRLKLVRSRQFNEGQRYLKTYRNKIIFSSNLGLWIYNSEVLSENQGLKVYQALRGSENTADYFILKDQIFLPSSNIEFVFRCDEKKGLVRMPLKGFDVSTKRLNMTVQQNGANHRVIATFLLNTNKHEAKEIKLNNDTIEISSVRCAKGREPSFHLKNVNVDDWKSILGTLNARDQSIVKDGLAQIVKDKEGNYWFAGNGLFVEYKQPPIREIGGLNNNITAIAGSEDFLLAATYDGTLLKIDPRTNKVLMSYSVPTARSEIDFFKIITFLKKIDGDLFVVSSQSNTYIFNQRTGIFRKISDIGSINDAAYANHKLFLFIEGLWSECYDLRDPESTNLSFLPPPLLIKGNPKHSFAALSSGVYQTHRHRMAIARSTSLSEFNSGEYKEIRYQHKPIRSAVLLYANQCLYIASKEHGLLSFTGSAPVEQLISPKDLTHLDIDALKIVNHQIWLLGDGNMQIYDFQRKKLMPNNITGEINLEDIQQTGNRLYGLSSGKIYSIDADAISPLKFYSFRESLVVNGQDTLFNDHNQLPYNKNNFAFNLRFPLYASPEKTYYKYRLLGNGETEWRYTRPGESTIYFTSVQPGKYLLEAKALHPYIGESLNYVSFHVSVLPPWWRTWWSKLSIVLFFIFITSYLIRSYYNRKFKFQQLVFDKAMAVEKERQRISAEIHDDIGQSLSVIKLHLNMNPSEQLQEAKEILNHVINELRDISHRLQEGKALKANLGISIQKELSRINSAGTLNGRLHISGKELVLDEEKELLTFRVVQEALNNVIKHAKATNVHVYLHYGEDGLNLIITDDGSGFLPQQISGGIGLHNMKKRVEVAGGTFELVSELDNGCQIRIFIPQSS